MAKLKNSVWSKKRLLLLGAIILVLLIALILLIKQRTKKTTSVIPVKDSSQNQPAGNNEGSDQTSKDNGVSTNSSSGSTSSTSPSSSVNSTPPANPSGSFVINHSHSLSGSEAERNEQSTCFTTPGASCYIQFTSGNNIKKLPTKTTDSSGSAQWNWDITSAGLTEGTWKITAVAELNSQTRTTDDKLSLEISK